MDQQAYDLTVERLALMIIDEEFEVIEQKWKDRRFTTYFLHKASNQQFSLEVYYRLGGMNYFSSRTEARGYTISVSPLELGLKDGQVYMTRYTSFTGYKELIEAANRFNAKKLEKHAKTYDLNHRLVRAYIARILQEQGKLVKDAA